MSGQGNDNFLPTAEEHAATRREVRDRRRRATGRGRQTNVRPAVDLFSGIQEDRAARRLEIEEARQATREQKAARELKFREERAELAITFLDDDLQGIARQVAELVLSVFPAVVPPPGVKRLRAAQDLMLRQLDDRTRKCTGAVAMGKSIAHDVLSRAYDQLDPSKNETASA